jgi:hypothetical protein
MGLVRAAIQVGSQGIPPPPYFCACALICRRSSALQFTIRVEPKAKSRRTYGGGAGKCDLSFGGTSDDSQPVTPDTVFTITSISKTVTATAMMKLVGQRRVDLNAPVRTYLPDFRVQDDAATGDVAIWHLPQLAPPGAVWSYENAGFALAGRCERPRAA